MSQALRVSIVIPAYNEAHHLQACLDSIATQNIQPYEVIVVDNNSRDQTAQIATSYSFVRVIRERRQGIVYARNAGFNAARGEIIARIDADDILPPSWLAQIHAFYRDPHHAQMVLVGRLFFYNFHLPYLFGILHGLLVQRTSRLLLGHYFPCGSNSTIPRAVWLSIRDKVCLRNDIHEDVDLGLHIHAAGYKIRYRWRHVAGVCMHRVADNHRQLWGYLAMWPRTYRVHHYRRSVVVWLFVGLIWFGSWFIYFGESFRRTPRTNH